MSCLPHFFSGFEHPIRERFALALRSAGMEADGIALIIADTTYERGEYKSEFAAISPPPQVRITWNGIASLWACAHAIARCAHRMFRAQRRFDASTDDVRLFLDQDKELEQGMDLFILSLSVCPKSS
jgi:hypothetical protein